MKRICILLLALIGLQSCASMFSTYEPQQAQTFATFLDFRPYTSEGFFISPDPYTGEHEPIGQLYLEIYPEQKRISDGKRDKYDQPTYINGMLYGYERLHFADVLEQAVVRAVTMGADGLVNLKISKITTGTSVRYEATGFCIKRK